MTRSRRSWILVPVVLGCAIAAVADQPAATLTGFTASSSSAERAIEQTFTTSVDASRARATHKELTHEPHIAGTPGDLRTAQYVARELEAAGFATAIEVESALLSEPLSVEFELRGPVKYSGPTPEFVARDVVSRNRFNPPAFNAYSASGDVTAAVVYANYGCPADYELLHSKGLSVAGRIVIARYGECYRGVKARSADLHEALGLLIYSDPRDDGYHSGDPYPLGPWRPRSSVQRGSVLYEFISPGIVAADESNVPHIPVMPLSYADASPILEHLAGPTAPATWQGGLPLTYHLGAGPATVRMNVRMSRTVRPIWNVVGKIRGTQSPEEIVLVGNHRDAWAYGGVDPNSGTTSMLEMARGLGVLLRQGWRPRRSIWLASWDAEEMGEFGSVQWAQRHAAELDKGAVAYLNVDYSVAGPDFVAAATPSMRAFITEAAADVADPAGGSILERATQTLRAARPQNSAAIGSETESLGEARFQPAALGGGSDFIAFFNHLGIASLDMCYDGSYGVYHSIFDNHRWMEHFGDPTFAYHLTVARMLGVMTLRLAAAEVLPLNYADYGEAIRGSINDLRRELTVDGKPPRVDFAPALAAADELTRTAKGLTEQISTGLARGDSSCPNWYEVNRTLARTEQAFLLEDGLPHRPWYKHALYAPGMDSGYAPVALPAVTEAVEVRDFSEAQRQISAVEATIHQASHRIKSALSLIGTCK